MFHVFAMPEQESLLAILLMSIAVEPSAAFTVRIACTRSARSPAKYAKAEVSSVEIKLCMIKYITEKTN